MRRRRRRRSEEGFIHQLGDKTQKERDRIEGEGRKKEGEERGMSEWGRREG